MASSIDTAFINSYHNDFEVQYQQNGSRLRSYVTVRPQTSQYDFYDRIGTVVFAERTTRHAPTVLTEALHTRIGVAMRDYNNALPFDNEDKLRMGLNDPRNAYANTQGKALGRQLDSVIITAATGSTITQTAGTNGTEAYTQATYGIAVDYTGPGVTPTNTNLTIEKLIKARSKLMTAEAIMDDEPVVFVCTQSQLDSLLRLTEVTNADYNTVKALVNGQIDTYMGFKFVRTELLTKSGNIRTCLAFPKSGIVVGEGNERMTKIDQRPDLNYTWQVWTEGTFGAARTWLEKIVAVLCDESVA